jgi:DNA-binding protein H-NS
MARVPKVRGNRDMSETNTADIRTQEFEDDHKALPSLDRIAEPELLSFVRSSLDQFTVESLSLLEDDIREKRIAKQNELKITARQMIEEQLKTAGLSLPDLFPELLPSITRKGGEGGQLPAKYRGPNGETWSGRGHEPKWITASGRNKEEFRIQEPAGSSLLFSTADATAEGTLEGDG